MLTGRKRLPTGMWAGRVDRYLEICTELVAQTGVAHVRGSFGLTVGLARVGRSGEAAAIADDALAAARAHANPYLIAFAYYGYGIAYAESDPHRALIAFHDGLAYSRQHPLPLFEAIIAREAAGLEATHGDIDRALDLFTVSLNSFYQAGSGVGWAIGGQVQGGLGLLFAQGTVVFDRIDQPEIAATLYGTATNNPAFILTIGFAAAVDHVRDVLGTDIFDNCARTGATMTFTEAVHYARHHIENAR